MANSDFEWDDVKDSTIIESVGAIAVYENPNGDVVVRQKGIDYGMDEDSVVIVPVRYLDALIKKLDRLKIDLIGTKVDK
ncbi:MAG: hypothetical protein GQ535_08050 [Rhodobacteraceae bacterium]|nr:hypothetical protein [Paracoccaceae bacterium]